ncbi:DedA family protein [Propioniciclava flava]|nr:VTT domain-containing protein [Propioniciclava flava]
MSEQPDPALPDASSGDDPAGEEWWQAEGMPWKHKPGRADIICLSAISVAAIYGLVMLPLRPVMLGLAPHLLGSLGYRTGLVLVGALAAVGDHWWPLVLVFGALMSMKFDWIYWWAGRLWGRSILDVWVYGKSPRTQRRYERAWGWARRYESLAIFVTFLPIPIPAAVVYAALGAAGTSLRKFLSVAFASALVTSAGYMALGYWIGEPAVAAVDTYGKYLWYVSIAILVGMLAVYFYRERQRAAAEKTGAARADQD